MFLIDTLRNIKTYKRLKIFMTSVQDYDRGARQQGYREGQ